MGGYPTNVLVMIDTFFSRLPKPASDDGFTLIELLITAVLLIIVLTAVLNMLDTSTKVANSDLERNISLSEQTNALSRMSAELRQAYQVNCPGGTCANEATASEIDFNERITESGGQQDRRVLYKCNVAQPGTSLDECVRYQAPNTTTAPGASCVTEKVCTSSVVIPRVLNNTTADPLSPNDPVFTKLRNPLAVQSNTWTAGQMTIKTSTGGERTGAGTLYKSDVILSNAFYMYQLDYGH